MNKIILNSFISSVIFTTTAFLIVFATNLITSIKDQTINTGDTIGSGWFQDVNNKLLDLYNTNGKIGIGTNEPASKLHIVAYSPLTLTRDVSGTHYGIKTEIDSSRFIVSGIGVSPASQIFTIRHDNGNVGINNISPLHKLHVNGDIMLQRESTNMKCQIQVQGGGCSSGWTALGSNNGYSICILCSG